MPTLEGIDLTCIRGDRKLFSGIHFSLDAGGLMQVGGPNGSGKTSLLRMLCGLATPAHGEIRWGGSEIRALGGAYFGDMTYLGHRFYLTSSCCACAASKQTWRISLILYPDDPVTCADTDSSILTPPPPLI